MEKALSSSELEKMGETISDRRFKDICVHRFTAEYKDIKIMMYRDPTFDIDQMQSIMRHLFLGLSFAQQRHQDRWSWRSHDCGIDLTSLREKRALRPQLLERKEDNDSKSTGAYNRSNNKKSSSDEAASNVGAEHKWCSVHRTASHDDTECYKQGAPRPPQSGRAHAAYAIRGASTRPNDYEKPSYNFADGFEEGFALSGLLAGSSNFFPQKIATGSRCLWTAASSNSLPPTQHPEDKGVCSYDVFLRNLGGTANTCCSSCSTGKQRRRSRRWHLQRDPRILHQLQHCHGAHHHGNVPTEKGTRAVPTKSCNLKDKKCTIKGGKITPEKATVKETERQHAQIPDITPVKAMVTTTERSCALVQIMLHYYKNNLLEEIYSSTTTGASLTVSWSIVIREKESSSPEMKNRHQGLSSSPEIKKSSSRAGALPQDVGVSLTAIAPAVTPGDANSAPNWAALAVPHHDTASTTPNPRVEDTFVNMHATGGSGTTPPTTCVNFICTERYSFRISEEENRVIEIPNKIQRCHPLHGSASPAITGTGIT